MSATPTIVEDPGENCFDPNRLCISKRCPHALAPLVTRTAKLPPSLCALDMPSQMTYQDIGAALGIDRHKVAAIEARALKRLAVMSRDWA